MKKIFTHKTSITSKIKRAAFALILACSLLFSASAHSQTSVTFPTGTFIVNMGVYVSNKTADIKTQLKPYGLIYDLIKNYNVPVYWVICPTKAKDGADFTYNGVNYKGGTFLIHKSYITTAVQARINYWMAQGVVGTTTSSSLVLTPAYKFSSVPIWTLDKQNGHIAEAFFTNAGIPTNAYNWVSPEDLSACNDVFVMPHADPNWAKHANLLPWNLNYKGAIWAGCHAVSALETIFNPDDQTQQQNYLTHKTSNWTGNGHFAENSLIRWCSHKEGSPPYVTTNPTEMTFPQSYGPILVSPSDPVAQFMGVPDAASQNGSEQIFLPVKGGGWLPTTRIVTYDPTQQNIPALSNGPAAVIVYGQGFGDPNRGSVMYQAGHNINKGTIGDVPAQRAFFNWSMLAAKDKSPAVVTVSGIPVDKNFKSQPYPQINHLAVVYSSPIGASLNSVTWTCTRSDNGGLFGTFSPNGTATAVNTTFIPSITTDVAIPCIITVKVIDQCGRVCFDSYPVSVTPVPRAPIAKADLGSISSTCVLQGYSAVVNALNNDYDPDGDPMTITNVTGVYPDDGTWSTNGTTVTFLPAHNFFGPTTATYTVCDNTPAGAPFYGPLCASSTIVVGVGTADANGCYPGAAYGIQSNSTITLANLQSQTATGAVISGTALNDGENTFASVNTDYLNLGTAYGNNLVLSTGKTLRAQDVINFSWSKAGNGTATISVQIGQSATGPWTNSQTFSLTPAGSGATVAIGSAYTLPSGATGINYVRFSAGTYSPSAVSSVAVWLDEVDYDYYSCVPAIPQAVNDAVYVKEDIPIKINVLANDVNPGNLPLTLTISSPPSHGKVSINIDNTITYINNTDYPTGGNATDAFTYLICNTQGLCSSGIVNLSISDDGCGAGLYIPQGTITVTVTYKEGTANTVEDTYIEQDHTANNHGTDPQWILGKKPNKSDRPILRFNQITTIPTNAYVTSAVFYMYETACSSHAAANMSLSLHSLSEAWTEINATWIKRNATTNWTTAGGTYNSTPFNTTIINTTKSAWKSFDMTNMVQQWVKTTTNGGVDNNGFLIKQTVETTSDVNITFASSENGTAANRPYLTITYLIPPYICEAIPNRAPLANPDNVTTKSNVAVTIPVLVNDADPDASNTLTLNSIIGTITGGSAVISGNNIVFTPNGTFTGLSTFEYSVRDNAGLKDTAYVYVNITNAPPVAANDNVSINSNIYGNAVDNTINVLANDVNPDGPSPLSTSITGFPNHGTATVSGTNIIYTPFTNYTGKDSLVYNACEPPDPNQCTGNLVCGSAKAVITVANRPPVPYADTYTISPCFPFVMNLVVNDIDPEQDILHVTALSALSNTLAGSLVNNGDGTVTYSPATGFIGTVTFTYKAIDGGSPNTPSTSSATVTINVVNAINHPPVAVNDTLETSINQTEDAYVLDNDYDPDNQGLSNPVITVNPLHGSATVDYSGGIEYTPNYNFWGLDSLTYKLCDIAVNDYMTCSSGGGLCAYAKLYIVVYKPNVNPTLNYGTPPSGYAICNGYNPRAYITPGSGGGIGATDLYEFSIDDGTTWAVYTSGAAINSTNALGGIQVRTSRSGGSYGIATGPITIAKWPIASPPSNPTLSSAVPPSGTSICSGFSGTASINPGSGGSEGAVDKYEYSFNGTTWYSYASDASITSAGTNATTINIRVSRTGGDYGCVTTSPVIIVTWSIIQSPTVPLVTVLQPTCALPQGRVVLSGLPFHDWTVNPDGVIGTSSTTTLTGLETGTYNYTVTDNVTGCVSPPVNALVNSQPPPPDAVWVDGGKTQCGGSVTLSAYGGDGGVIYWQGTTSGGTSTATPSNIQSVSASGTYYFRSMSSSQCWGDEGSADVIIVNMNNPYTPMEVADIHQNLETGGMVNKGYNATWLNQNWVTFDANGNTVSTFQVPNDTSDVLIYKGECVAPTVEIATSGVCRNLYMGEGTAVHLQKGNDLIIHGNFVNKGVFNVLSDTAGSGGKAVENIFIEGNWNNEAGEFYAGKSTVVFNGPGIQTIDTRYYPFYNLKINKPSGKSGEATLMEETTVNNVLSLESGKLNLNNNAVILTNSLPTAITRNTGYIYAETDPSNLYNKVRWNIGTRKDVYSVPFGRSQTEYLPFKIDIKKNSMGSSDYLDFSTFGTPSNNKPLPYLVSDLGMDDAGGGLIVDRYWYLGDQNSEMGKHLMIDGVLTFTYLKDELDGLFEWDMIAERFNPRPDSAFGVWADMIYSLNQYSNWENHGFCIDTPIPSGGNTGTFQTSYVDTFQFFNVWVLSSQSFPLPIKLLNFTAKCNNGSVEINWTTASENNNHFFTVERSTDGLKWDPIANVDGVNNSSTNKYYYISDPYPIGMMSYYRLKQTDNNGKTDIFNTVVVNCNSENGNEHVLIYPNPFSNLLNIYLFNLKDKNTQIYLYDALGKLIDKKSLSNLESEQYQYSMNISGYSDGVYYIKVISDDFTYNEKIVKKK